MAMWHLMFGMGLGLVVSLGLTLMAISSKQKALQYSDKGRTYNSTPNENCAICLFSMTNDDMLYLPCGHAYHDDCIKNLRRHKDYKCPTCRQDFS